MSEQDLPEFPVNSRFHLLPLPTIQPGSCSVCGSVERPVLDFMANIDFYGAILICTTCMSEAAGLLGMIEPRIHNKLKEDLAQTFETMLSDRDMVGIPRERYNAIVVAVSGLSDGVLYGDNSGSVMVAGPHGEIQPALFDDDAAYDSDTEGSAQGNSGSSEQDDNSVVSEGPVSLSSSHGDGISARI